MPATTCLRDARFLLPLCGLMMALAPATVDADPVAVGPRVLADGKVPGDKRLEPLKDLNGYLWEPDAYVFKLRFYIAPKGRKSLARGVNPWKIG